MSLLLTSSGSLYYLLFMSPTKRTTRPDAATASVAPLVASFYLLIGERVRSHRSALGMTQEALAKAAGTARTSITNLEKGLQHVPLHVLLAIAGEFGVEVADLLPKRAELTAANDVRVAVDVGEGDVRMVTAKTALAISQLMDRLPARR